MNKNIPKLRFNEFNDEWQTKKLGEVFEINAGGDIAQANVSSNKNEVFCYPIYANSEKNKGLYGYSDIYKIQGKVITVTGRGALGIAVARNEKFYPIVRLLVLRHKYNENINFFENAINNINIHKESTGVPQLTAPQISGYTITFPTLPEQEKIADFLMVVDEKLEKMKEKKQYWEQYKKGIMQKIFSQEIRFKDNNGNNYPDWEEKRLGEIGETYNGLSGKTKEDFGDGAYYVQYKQIFDNSKIDITNFGKVFVDKNENQNKVKFGDAFFTISSETPNEIGTSSVLLNEVDNLYLNSFCFGFRTKVQNTFNPYFSRFLFRSKYFRDKIVMLGQGSTRFNMSKNEFVKLYINLPSYEEQTKIADFLSSIDAKIEQINSEILELSNWKKGLLQQMFV